jgi:GntR family transcriptional regulator
VSLDPTDPRPPYRQIADQLRDAIRGGEFTPGSQLPSERELVERYGTAPQTVREAIKVLKGEGLVVGMRGRGVYVRKRPPLVLRLEATRRYVSQARAVGRDAEARLLGVELTTASAEVAERLEVPEGSDVLTRRYLLLLDGEPAQTSESYFPGDLTSGTVLASHANVTPEQIDAELETRFGVETASFHDELSIRMPDPDETRLLRLLPGTPVGVLWRTYRDRSGRAVEAVRFVLAGDKQTLVYDGRLPATKRSPNDHAPRQP